MGRALDTIAPIAAGVLGSVLLPGIGTALGATLSSTLGGAIGSGLYSGIHNHSLAAGIGGGLGSYVGGSLGSQFGGSLGSVGSAFGNSAENAVGPAFGSIGGAASSGLGSALGEGAANSIGANLANAGIGSALGSYAGNSLGTGLASSLSPPEQPSGPAPFKPTQNAQMSLPSSLSGFSDLSPLQQSTNLATQGVYGGGLGPQEQQYFLNLENRKLVDQGGQTSDMSSLNPIENSYLSQLGLGGQNNTSNLLQAISQWSPS